MIKILSLFFVLNLISLSSWSQIDISGVIISKKDGLQLPGVNIIEKGTKIGATTDFDGLFKLTVSNKTATLIISSIGFITQEIKIKEQKGLIIKLKEDCNRCWFDKQHIGFYLNTDIINNPIGGLLNFSLPAIFGEPTLKAEIGYQTNLEKNYSFLSNIGLYHLFANCDFNSDINVYYKNTSRNNQIDLSKYALDTNMNFNRISSTIGFSSIKYNDLNKTGAIIGIGTWIGQPFSFFISAKTTFYDGLNEYQAEINKQHKAFYGFLRYYNLEKYNELSIGLGLEIIYRSKKQIK